MGWIRFTGRLLMGMMVTVATTACGGSAETDTSPVAYQSQTVFLTNTPKGRGIAADEFLMQDFPHERFCGDCWIVRNRIKGGVGLPFADPAKGENAMSQISDDASLLVFTAPSITDLSIPKTAFTKSPRVLSPRETCRVLTGQWNGHRRTAVVTSPDIEVDQDTSACGMVAILLLAGLSDSDALDFERFTTYEKRWDKYVMDYAALDAFVATGG